MDNFNPGYGYDECVARGICSVSPALSSMQAVVLVYLEELAFYILELETLGVKNEKIKHDILDAVSGLIIDVDYSQENFNYVISVLYNELYQAREFYSKLCRERDQKPFYLKSPIKLHRQLDINTAIKQGQKYFARKEQNLDEEQKELLDILMIIIKSACLYLVELQDLGVEIEEEFKGLLAALSIMNFNTISTKKAEEIIEKYIKIDHQLMQKTFEARKKEFGEFIKTELPLSTREGKAILVSGSNMKDLEMLLEATKDKGIDVYTHGHMAIAHAFAKFKNYPHLIGHYGRGAEYFMADFSAFPGPIFLTKLSLHKVEHLYHNRVFTTDSLACKGVSIIKNYDFESLIKSTNLSEGFWEDTPKQPVEFGIDETSSFDKLNDFVQKIQNNEIKNVIFIGVSDRSRQQKEYFDEFLKLAGDDCLVISFSYSINKPLILTLNIDYGFPFAYKIIDIIQQKKDISELNTAALFCRCEPHTFANFFYMKHIGIKNIYFAECSPNLINPTLVEKISKRLGLRHYTNPKSDFRQITQQ